MSEIPKIGWVANFLVANASKSTSVSRSYLAFSSRNSTLSVKVSVLDGGQNIMLGLLTSLTVPKDWIEPILRADHSPKSKSTRRATRSGWLSRNFLTLTAVVQFNICINYFVGLFGIIYSSSSFSSV